MTNGWPYLRTCPPLLRRSQSEQLPSTRTNLLGIPFPSKVVVYSILLLLLSPLSFNQQQKLMPRRVVASGRSCLECRRRKIKCDRSLPCAYCVRTHIRCAYPQPKTDGNADHSVGNDLVARMESIESRFLSLEQSLAQVKQLLHTGLSLPSQEQDQLRPVSLSFTIQKKLSKICVAPAGLVIPIPLHPTMENIGNLSP
ncbi:hypothetical protein BDV26DRAFT_93837 [Aspergillus bertholletiae]|uniref:Zn(2)-C6 fungal-type domain-containing protein n=1 Tax=Aspergillus bertholletiae TaxID=1226010 RepID=A0A5N7BP71_9EURO|nr:hypothetical protein BDV26DRAFT_93837 [Aspergillus bertholletiae]